MRRRRRTPAPAMIRLYQARVMSSQSAMSLPVQTPEDGQLVMT